MCFYCKAHNSRYMQYGELLFDKAYKYKIRNYKHNMIYSCDWYIDFNCYREDDKFTYVYLNMNGKVLHLGWQPNEMLHRNYDKPAFIIPFKKGKYKYNDRIYYLSWNQNGRYCRRENKPNVIQLHFNGNINYLGWYYIDMPLHINKLHNLYLNENGDID